MPTLARDGDDHRIIANSGITSSPRWKVRHGVGPANSDHTCVSGLPAVAAATHPVVGIGQRHATHAVRPGKRNGPFHTLVGIQIAWATVSVPALQWPAGR